MAKRDLRSSTDGETTTGHEWDGITELNKPLPKWWLWTFYATIVWAIGYWLLMPAWPLVSSYSKGLLGYSQRERVAEQVAEAKVAKSDYRDTIAAMDLTAINNDPELLSFALAGGEAAFGDNCAPCHGRGAQGAFGYPNLRDDSWLWGDGTLAAIHKTILHGIRSGDPDTQTNQMPAFGRTGVLNEPQIAHAGYCNIPTSFFINSITFRSCIRSDLVCRSFQDDVQIVSTHCDSSGISGRILYRGIL
jgi:cytochrome c oxidase cbb3-type subunit 3